MTQPYLAHHRCGREALWMVALVLAATGCATGSALTDLAGARHAMASATQRAGLPTVWAPFDRDLESYEVHNAAGAVVMRVIAVSAQRSYAREPQGTLTVKMPRPLIVAADGSTVGELPYNYPDDPPFDLRVRFVAWSDGWPQRIELQLTDPTVSGNRALPPLLWDPATRRFRDSSEK